LDGRIPTLDPLRITPDRGSYGLQGGLLAGLLASLPRERATSGLLAAVETYVHKGTGFGLDALLQVVRAEAESVVHGF